MNSNILNSIYLTAVRYLRDLCQQQMVNNLNKFTKILKFRRYPEKQRYLHAIILQTVIICRKLVLRDTL